MEFFYRIVLRLRLWDCDYAIQRVNYSIARQQEELKEREALKHQLQLAVFNAEHP